MTFTIENPDTTLKKVLPALKQASDFIVVLSQMGVESDRKIAGKWKDIDLIIGGHSQTLMEKAVIISKTIIVQAGKNGGRVGELVVTFDTPKNEKVFHILFGGLPKTILFLQK
jgi:2',3'-cyclic-nucleotide 2'-phosphodiesterase (5'-nucleotidase family)